MSDSALAAAAPKAAATARRSALIVAAASAGAVFEWYDFFLYGSLASFISAHFFSGVNETTAYIFALLAFAAGFAIRPLGALVFGRLGDLWGRKNTFLATLLLMGLSTFVAGLLPSFKAIGLAAPVMLISCRLLQGLAIGGEYGGAATYVAEHAPQGLRGWRTSWIQATATLGLLLSLLVILALRANLGEADFKAWGWRIPFLISALLLVASLWIRLRLSESPVFQRMIDEGRGSRTPLAESFGRWENLKLVLVALFGVAAGQAVVWYTGQFYSLFFLEKTLRLDYDQAYGLAAAALALGAPGFVFFGWLSDRVGRKPVVIAGLALAAATYFPIFQALTRAANPDLAAASVRAPVQVVADPRTCSLQFDPIGKRRFDSACDLAKAYLAKAGVGYANAAAEPSAVGGVRIGGETYPGLDLRGVAAARTAPARAAWERGLAARLKAAGYPAKAARDMVDAPRVVALLTLLVIYATMVYGPLAALLVELFPTRIRYTALSLPYHIGNGWFGGFLPTAAFAIVAATGQLLSGLWYPVAIAGATAAIGVLFLRETRDADLER